MHPCRRFFPSPRCAARGWPPNSPCQVPRVRSGRCGSAGAPQESPAKAISKTGPRAAPRRAVGNSPAPRFYEKNTLKIDIHTITLYLEGTTRRRFWYLAAQKVHRKAFLTPFGPRVTPLIGLQRRRVPSHGVDGRRIRSGNAAGKRRTSELRPEFEEGGRCASVRRRVREQHRANVDNKVRFQRQDPIPSVWTCRSAGQSRSIPEANRQRHARVARPAARAGLVGAVFRKAEEAQVLGRRSQGRRSGYSGLHVRGVRRWFQCCRQKYRRPGRYLRRHRCSLLPRGAGAEPNRTAGPAGAGWAAGRTGTGGPGRYAGGQGCPGCAGRTGTGGSGRYAGGQGCPGRAGRTGTGGPGRYAGGQGCQWQPKTAHFRQLKTAQFGGSIPAALEPWVAGLSQGSPRGG